MFLEGRDLESSAFLVWYVDGYRGFDEVIKKAKIPKNPPRATTFIRLSAFRGD